MPENARFLEWFLKYADLLGGRDKSDAFEAAIPKTYGDIFQIRFGRIRPARGVHPANLKAEGIDLDYGITPDADGGGACPCGTAYTGGGNLFLLPTNAAHPAEAVAFIQYMGTDSPSSTGASPTRTSRRRRPPLRIRTFRTRCPSSSRGSTRWRPNHMVPPMPVSAASGLRSGLSTMIDEVTYKQKSPAGSAGRSGGQDCRRSRAVPAGASRLGGGIGAAGTASQCGGARSDRLIATHRARHSAGGVTRG